MVGFKTDLAVAKDGCSSTGRAPAGPASQEVRPGVVGSNPTSQRRVEVAARHFAKVAYRAGAS